MLRSAPTTSWGRAEYLVPFREKYDAVILSSKDYARKLTLPQLFFMPAIDPFTITNREFSQCQIDERLKHYDIPRDFPLVVQISRFDRWKDPVGVLQAFKLAGGSTFQWREKLLKFERHQTGSMRDS